MSKVQGWGPFLEELLQGCDILAVADRLGMRVTGKGSGSLKTLCPFHDDRTASLYLYQNRSKGKSDAFHCFACHAHGDAIALVRQVHRSTFKDAVEWIARLVGRQVPRMGPTEAAYSSRERGLLLALEVFNRLDSQEKELLQNFCRIRGYEPEIFRKLKIGITRGGKLTRYLEQEKKRTHSQLRQEFEDLEEAQLLKKEAPTARLNDRQNNIDSPSEPEFHDFYYDSRVLIPLHNHRGALAGFAGRAIAADGKPKYLYTKGFPRAAILYRLNKVINDVQQAGEKIRQKDKKEKGWTFDLYLVEGLFDALRLEMLEIPTCAVLGSALSEEQAKLLVDLAVQVGQAGGILNIHFFFDFDEPGKVGAARSIRLLWSALLKAQVTPFIDAIYFQAPKKDPDELFKNTTEKETVLANLRNGQIPALQVIMASVLACSPDQVAETWRTKAPDFRQWALQTLETDAPRLNWNAVLHRFQPLSTAKTENYHEPGSWEYSVLQFLSSEIPKNDNKTKSQQKADINERQERRDYDAGPPLLRAHHLALASHQKREFPLDLGSWVRLATAFDSIELFYKEILSQGTAQRLEHYLAVYLPKASGGLRLKALPCPEDLTLQQYVLTELLQTYPDHPQIRNYIPAVRWFNGQLQTTGWVGKDQQPLTNVETVSFAYQIDMSAVDQPTPSQRPMFRPYFDCWADFIRSLERSLQQIDGDLIYSARLDVKSFYDRILRQVINGFLPGAIAHALTAADAPASLIAPLLTPRPSASLTERARQITDWLCDQSFDYTYLDPETAQVKRPQYSSMGIPQGPDLSAYLANITLFGLDQAVSELLSRLNSEGRVAAYARYVDDIVILANRLTLLEDLQNLIVQQLADVGLSLGAKGEPQQPRSKARTRIWLTEQRSLGTDYGPQPDVLENFQIATKRPDRGHALLLLRQVPLKLLVNDPESVQKSILLVQKAKLRATDEVRIAKLQWLLVAHDLERNKVYLDQTDLPATAKEILERHLRNHQPAEELEFDQSQSFKNSWPELCQLEGLYQALGLRMDRSPNLNSEEQVHFNGLRTRLADLVSSGIFDWLAGRLPSSLSKFTYQKFCWRLLIIAAAKKIKPGARQHSPTHFSEEIFPPRLFRHLCTLHTLAPDQTTLEVLRIRRLPSNDSPSMAVLRYFHEAVARLMASREDSEELSTDILHSLRERPWNEGGSSILCRVLELWLPEPHNEKISSSSQVGFCAVRSFVNCSSKKAAAGLSNRRHLLHHIFINGQFDESTRLLATPPASEYPGIFAVNSQNIRAVVFGNVGDVRPLPQLDWQHDDSAAPSDWKCWIAALDGWKLSEPAPYSFMTIKKDEEKIDALKGICNAFTLLAVEVTSNAIPTSHHFLSRRNGHQDEEWQILGFPIKRGIEGVGAYISKRPMNSLMTEPIPSVGAQFWRLGVALCDLYHAIDRESADPETRYSAPDLGLPDGANLAVDVFIRYTLASLRGSRVSLAGMARGHTEDKIKPLLERTLARAAEFTAAFSSEQETKLFRLALGTFFEARYFNATRTAANNPGFVSRATLIGRAARNLFGTDAKICTSLPSFTSYPEWFPKRRAALAWLALAERISLLTREEPDDLLEVLAAAFRILSIGEHLRAQVLERWYFLHISGRSLAEWSFSLSDWGVPDSSLECGDGESLENIMADLFEPLATDSNRTQTPEQADKAILHPLERRSDLASHLIRLERVPPLAWLAALASLAGLTSGNNNQRTALLRDAGELKEPLRHLALLLSEEVDPDAQLQAANFATITDGLNGSGQLLRNIFLTLYSIDTAFNLDVTLEKSNRLQYISGNESELKISSQRFDLREVPGWVIRELRASTAQRGATEEWETIKVPGSQIATRLASLTGCDKFLLGASWITSSMAALAGLTGNLQTGDPLKISQRSYDSQPSTKEPDKAFLKDCLTPVTPSSLGVQEQCDDTTSNISDSNVEPDEDPPSSSDEHDQILANFMARLQEPSWLNRGATKLPSMARIAFLQWNVDQSYRHPHHECCESGKDGRPRRKSCAEHRRRKILSVAIQACRNFKVEVLVLPEYSVRPETIEWLLSSQIDIGDISIWAGTYKLPHGFSSSSVFHELGSEQRRVGQSIHTVITPEAKRNPGKLLQRAKKYPAVALGESFNPGRQRLKPVFSSFLELEDLYGVKRQFFDHRPLILELICSEVFLLTSPANWTTLAAAYAQLLAKYASANRPTEIHDPKDLLEDVITDVRSLAQFISYASEVQWPRRTILLVPAMTTRTADYAALGQSNYLSASITTVFCNSTKYSDGRGNSCFIGHDCWDREDAKQPADYPSPGPYHGLTPGIFRQHAEGRGWLGHDEQALVIADVDPLHSAEGKPRPQALPPPLSLVAHLPLIESWSRPDQTCQKPSTGRTKGTCKCNIHVAKPLSSDGFNLNELAQALDPDRIRIRQSTLDDDDPSKLGGLLRNLATRAGANGKDWLYLRAKAYEEKAWTDPAPWPPPAAVDWLWIDLGKPGADGYPEIDVPPVEPRIQRQDGATDRFKEG